MTLPANSLPETRSKLTPNFRRQNRLKISHFSLAEKLPNSNNYSLTEKSCCVPSGFRHRRSIRHHRSRRGSTGSARVRHCT